MMVYCTSHFGMYDNRIGCPYCPKVAQRTGGLTVKSLVVTLRASGLDLIGHDLYFNEWTYRQLLLDPDTQQWLDIAVPIDDWVDPWGNLIKAKPVPDITEPVSQLLGATIFIDPNLKDYTVSSKGIVVSL